MTDYGKLFNIKELNMENYRDLPYDQLRTLHREIGVLIAEKRQEALQQLRQQAAILGCTAAELAPESTKQRRHAAKYRDPEAPDHTWSGKGKRPAWLVEALDSGRQLEEFLVAN